MSQSPPPPPPHGESPRSSGGGLGPGKYDIFVIPQRDKGGGFIYLPSMQPNVNSFAAGFASCLVMVALFQSMAPAFQAWWNSFQGMGSMGVMMLIVAVGLGAWALGRTSNEGPNGPGGSSGFGGAHPGASTGHGTNDAGSSSPPPPPPHNNGPPPGNGNANPPPGGERPKPSWQRPPQPGTTRTETPKGTWERAREETRKREEERKAKEEEEKRRADAARRLKELREKEAREREAREREARERQERLEKERREKEELKQKLEKEKAERERLEKEVKEREERLRKEKEDEAAKARTGSTYAFSAVGEKTNPWPQGKPKPSPSAASSAFASASGSARPRPPASPSSTSSPTKPATSTASSNQSKRPPAPTAKTYLGTEDEYSYRPYDQPKRSGHKKAPSSVASETSWAPSHSTARTTPPPSMRAPYATKDPDKIVIRAVYLFMNQFAKTPASQLVSGVGSVTDGLILRVTTEGLFIDDDVRGVPQREWDVKAWTLKLVEVWCPTHCLSDSASSPASASANNNHHPGLFAKMASQRARAADRGGPKTLTGDEADAYLTEMLRACKDYCRLGMSPGTKDTNAGSASSQNGEYKAKGLHVLRATVRDQEGKRYMFVLNEEEAWKVAVGVQRLRRGTQVRALGVSGMSAVDARMTLETLGWV